MSGEWDAGGSWTPFVQDCLMSAGDAPADTAAGEVFTDLCGGPLYAIARHIAYVEACDTRIEGLGARIAPEINEAIALLEKLRETPDMKAHDNSEED